MGGDGTRVPHALSFQEFHFTSKFVAITDLPQVRIHIIMIQNANQGSSAAPAPAQQESETDGGAERTRSKVKVSLGDQLREGSRELLTTGKQQLVGRIGVYESAVLDASSRLRDEEHRVLAQQLESAADSVGRARQYLGDHSTEELVDEVGEFCRRHPAACFAGAFLAGLAAARIIKASTPRRENAEGDPEEND